MERQDRSGTNLNEKFKYLDLQKRTFITTIHKLFVLKMKLILIFTDTNFIEEDSQNKDCHFFCIENNKKIIECNKNLYRNQSGGISDVARGGP